MSEKGLDRSSEELSALLDGEISELELRRLLKNIESDQELCQKWSRYQLSSAILKGQTRGKALEWQNVDISARVQQAVADEPALEVSAKPKSRIRSGLIKPFANVAVAASVSAAVIVGWQSVGQQPINTANGPAPALAAASASPGPSVATPVSTVPLYSGQQPTSPRAMPVSQNNFGYSVLNQGPQPEMIRYNPDVDDRLNYYFLSHSGNAAANTASSVSPYGRVITINPTAEEKAVRVNLEQ
ncbi:sigma-E factor negative regulatory protein [Ketobacter sp. MCCC 1A13808]|uniref:sigma-E factor negative regulatory protein n=1 Tax=Ketobacter sp. MCCC 1A13808 TaxID=2602738 RepID=UPI000F17511F|nr:sigma-E factor negative regulatory protein [Ketobacter sp. MCCC 1A13808]MVF14692.1 sigma-E factor negative regulatory protein [Ketobacter sp. MCCC 1A13808]RLP53940.1 MAG: hypothetical protein D6160_12785 [Ketobacter sp.]